MNNADRPDSAAVDGRDFHHGLLDMDVEGRV
jgi:hypothetical protein